MIDLFPGDGPYCGLFNIDFGFKKGNKILDVGGGNKPYPASTHVCDFVDHKEQRHFQELKIGNRELLNGDVVEILKDYEDNFFDFCYSSHTFEHIVDLKAAIKQISRTCKRGYYALPGSDIEFLTAKKHFGHVNLCRQIGDTLHFCKRPANTILDKMGRLFEYKLFNDPEFNQMFEGHGQRGYRFIWEIRHYWEETIPFVFYEDGSKLYPQLRYFK